MDEQSAMVADGYGPRPDSSWRSVPWREHLRQVQVDGAQVNLVDIGRRAGSPAVVFVHGLGANWQSWLENVAVLAAAGHRVVALDLPGFGFSQMPREQLTIRRMARGVEGTMEAVGLDSAVIVGNSMGGFVGAELAISAPARVEKLVLVSAAALWSERRRARPTVVLAKASRVYAARLYGQWELAWRHPKLRVPALLSAGIRRPAAIPPDLSYELMQAAGAPGFTDGVSALFEYKIRDRLPEIAAPTLVVWGTNDPLVPLWHAFEYESLIPQCRVVIFRDTGHVPMLERPERFNSELVQFLGDVGVGVADEPAVELA